MSDTKKNNENNIRHNIKTSYDTPSKIIQGTNSPHKTGFFQRVDDLKKRRSLNKDSVLLI